MLTKKIVLVLSVIFLVIPSLYAQKSVTTGPEKGTLVIVGGGKLDDSIVSRFVELAGGNDANIVIIPTAGGRDFYDQDSGQSDYFRDAGADSVAVIHTDDKEVANSDKFIKPLKTATGVWFSGGRQWRLVDAYAGTKVEEELWKLLERDGVIGGSSAGASIQGSYLARGDTETNQIMMGDHAEGFGFVKNIAIDQHVIARNRHFDMLNILKNKPELLGISIDESTAVVVEGNEFEVIGRSYVIIYDGTFWSREGSDLKQLPPSEDLFYFLRSGDKYNLEERTVIEN